MKRSRKAGRSPWHPSFSRRNRASREGLWRLPTEEDWCSQPVGVKSNLARSHGPLPEDPLGAYLLATWA